MEIFKVVAMSSPVGQEIFSLPEPTHPPPVGTGAQIGGKAAGVWH